MRRPRRGCVELVERVTAVVLHPCLKILVALRPTGFAVRHQREAVSPRRASAGASCFHRPAFAVLDVVGGVVLVPDHLGVLAGALDAVPHDVLDLVAGRTPAALRPFGSHGSGHDLTTTHALLVKAGHAASGEGAHNSPATVTSASSSWGGSERPRRVARRRIPAAALLDSEYFSEAFGSRISVKDGAHEHSSAPLGHPEVLRVKSSPRRQIPEFGQRVEDDPEVCAFRASRAVEPFDVFNEDGSGAKSTNDSHELEEESAAVSGEAGAFACDANVLAGEASAEEIDVPGAGVNVMDVLVDSDPREPGGEGCSAVGVDLREEAVVEPGTLEADVHPPDSGEEGSAGEWFMLHHSPTRSSPASSRGPQSLCPPVQGRWYRHTR